MTVVGMAAALAAVGLLGPAPRPAAASVVEPAEPVQVVARAVTNPGGITSGPDGNLWFASSGNDSIGRITPAGVITSFSGGGISTPDSITVGPDGNLWFTNFGNRTIGRITPGGIVSSFGHVALSNPVSITRGPDGNLWFVDGSRIWRSSPGGAITLMADLASGSAREITAGPDGNLWFTPSQGGVGRITPTGVVSDFTGFGVSSPQGITAGPDGNLWFTNAGNNSIGRITPGGAMSNFTGPGISNPQRITLGPDGNLWFANRGISSIGRITPAGVVSSFSDPSITAPAGIAAGPDGNLWFTNFASGSIGRITPAGAVSELKGPGISSPWDIVTGPDGNLWFPNLYGRSIGRVTPAGLVSTFTGPGVAEPYGIAVGPDGNLWFTNRASSSIGRITPGGVVSNFTDPSISMPQRITAGPDGSLWFTNRGDASTPGSIGRITTGGLVSSFTGPGISMPHGIVTGPDGNLWFTDGGSIGRITPAGVVTSFTGAGGGGYGIAAGPDGNLWFTSRDGGSIGRITTAGVVTSFTDPAIHYPEGIAAGPDGNLWFANGAGSLGRITPAGLLSTFNRPDMNATTVTPGPGGKIWFASRGNLVGYVTPGRSGAPGAVTAAARTGEATVSWAAPTDDAGSPVTGYTVTALPGGQTCSWSSGPLSCTVSGLLSGPYTFTVAGTTARGPGGASSPSPAFVPPGVALHPLSPTRILDSRPGGPQVGPYGTPWAAGEVRDVTVAGGGAVPADAEAVVANVTVTDTSAAGYLTIWPAGSAQPLASSLNWAPGRTVANAVTVKVGAGGKISISNPVGSTHVLVDIVGYYGDIRFADGYTPLTPARILDSRPAGPQVGPYGTPWGAGQTRDVTVAGVGGVPGGADAVVVNVTVTSTTAAGYLTIWPSGFGQPLASSLNWGPGQTVANAVTVKVGAGGRISVLNPVGSAHVIIDVVGSFAPLTGALFHPLSPARIQDSRPAGPQVGPYATPWGAGTTRTVQVTGAGGVPTGAIAALLNVTATGTTAASYLTVAPAGEAPLASSLNWQAGQTVANAVPAKLSPGGAFSARNAAGLVDVLADASGWYG